MKFKKALLLSLVAGSLILSGCGNQKAKRFTIHFDVNTDVLTTPVDDQYVKEGMHVKTPNCIALDDEYSTYIVFGWYTEKSCQNQWNFKKYYPSKNMTLYAKWGYTYDVSYYVGSDQTLVTVDTVREGSTVKEKTSSAEGFIYQGSYADPEYTEEFDFSKPIYEDTSIYIKRSDGIYFSETNSTGALSSYLTAYRASSSEDNPSVAGDATAYTTASGETYTLLDFGYSPTVTDPYFEISLHVDITKSQILRFTMKNLGYSVSSRIYFTSLIDDENSVYSATGRYYTEKYVCDVPLSKTGMNADDDEWITVDYDLSEVLKDGYSVWGSSNYLAAIRIQSSYRSTSQSDRSNKWLIKSIEGIYKEIIVDDTENVKTMLNDDSAEDIKTVSDAQEENNGFIFPKDLDMVSSTTTDAKVYKRKDGLLMYTDNEVSLFDNEDYTRSIITILKPTDSEGNIIGNLTDLDENSTLDLTLKNFGYQTSLSIYIYNDIGDLVVSELTIDSEMPNFKTYSINLYKYTSMTGNLSKVEIRYTALGINNALLIKSIDFSGFKKNDIAGINFNDKECAKVSSVEGIDVSFNRNRLMTKFDVSDSTKTVASSTLDVYPNNYGFSAYSMQAVVLASSEINNVSVKFTFENNTTYTATFELDRSLNGKVQNMEYPIDMDNRGLIKSYELSFDGTGTIYIGKIAFVNDSDSPYYFDFNNDYSSYLESYWKTNLNYSYDSENEYSIFSNTDGVNSFSWRFHIGFLALKRNPSCPYTKENPLLEDKTKIMFVYQNRSSTSNLNIGIFLSDSEDGTGDEGIGNFYYDLTLKTNMNAYEWDVVEHTFTADELAHRLGKLVLSFSGEIRLRAIVIE